ncbi:MAG: helix-turn-helix domain-containing protein, partial [Thermoleophilia bacterium]|nr:helix-turn-helix domain-containing protein [Thermoleophilia bacterium]
MEIGNTLREARLRKGLSIKDVEDATKIRAKYLQALEDDDFEVLPGPTFVKAFLRTYATFLKLDADALVEEYKSSHEPQANAAPLANVRINGVTSSTRRGKNGRRSERTRIAAERQKKRVRRTQRGYALVAVIAVVIVVLLAWFGSG